MKKQFTFSIDTSKVYFWVILILIILLAFQNYNTPKIDTSNERKLANTITNLKYSLKAIKTDNIALKSKLENQKTEYKTIIIEKDAKKNNVNSLSDIQLRDAITKRY